MQMRSRSMGVAVCLSLCCVAGAVVCHLRASSLKQEAAWILVRGQTQAQEYASTFDGTLADQQLKSFEERRATLERAQLWQLFERLLILMSAVGAFSSYVLYLLRRLREQLVEATSAEPPGTDRPAPVHPLS